MQDAADKVVESLFQLRPWSVRQHRYLLQLITNNNQPVNKCQTFFLCAKSKYYDSDVTIVASIPERTEHWCHNN